MKCSKTKIVCLDHPHLLRKSKNIVSEALNSMCVFHGGRRVYLCLGADHPQCSMRTHEITCSDIYMFFLRLCPLLLQMHTENVQLVPIRNILPRKMVAKIAKTAKIDRTGF